MLFGHSLFRAPQLDRTRADAHARTLAHFCTDMVDWTGGGTFLLSLHWPVATDPSSLLPPPPSSTLFSARTRELRERASKKSSNCNGDGGGR